MSPSAALTLAVAIVAEVVATSALRQSDGFTRLGPSSLAVLGYGIAFYCLALTMRSVPVGIIYAIWSGVGIVLLAVIGWALFGEALDRPALVGIGLILTGVLVLNLLSGSVRP